MARLTVTFGIVLILLGVFAYMGTGVHYRMPLIACGVGILLCIFGFIARTGDLKRRMLNMHIAVTIGLLGFLGTVNGVYDYVQMSRGRQFAYPIAVEEKAAMSVLLLVYVILCVRSFVSARRARA